MRKLVLTLLAVVSLSGCAPLLTGLATSTLPAPSSAANKTVLDEKGLLGVETAYAAMGLVMDLVPLNPQRAAKLAELDNRAYKALLVARAAYATGNADSYDVALRQADTVIREVLSIITPKK